MSKQVQLRRGTTAENDAFTGAAGEITVDTTLNELRVHDGVTLGGHVVSVGKPMGVILLPSGVGAEYIPSDGAVGAIVHGVGAGGGSGGVAGSGAATGTASSAGGGGGYFRKFVDVNAGPFIYTIGSKGVGGLAGSNAGTDGGDTTFDATGIALVAYGGEGGNGRTGSAGTSMAPGADGGVATGGDLNISGGGVGVAGSNAGEPLSAHAGGSSFLGGGTSGVVNSNGKNAITPGAGGGAVSTRSVATSYAGSDGGDGLIFIEELF